MAAARHASLRHHLDPADATRPADAAWLRTRAGQYAHLTGLTVQVITDPSVYHAATGRDLEANIAGQAYRGELHARLKQPILFLRPALIPTRGAAELTIAHEFMHLRWWSYGHRQVAFARAQALLDAASAMDMPDLAPPPARAGAGDNAWRRHSGKISEWRLGDSTRRSRTASVD